MTMPEGPLLLVGGGKMGGALLAGWRARGLAADAVTVVEPAPATAADLARRLGVRVVASVDALAPDFAPEVVVLAVKPQTMAAAVAPCRRFGHALFLSIAAGTTLAFFARALGSEVAVVRAMPNTPAAIGRGVSALVANAHVEPRGRAIAEALMAAVGEVVWLDDEALMDAVTAVSGSGPAYVFLLIECLAEAGAKAGLPADLALKLARATVAGAGALAEASDAAPATLRENVTSPGGTTAAALAVLRADDGLCALLERAVAAAAARSRELAG